MRTQRRQRHAKIVATLGPSSSDKDVVEGRKEPVRVYAKKDKTGDAA